MASNARFHNKWHRRNHHSQPSPDYPDSATDPIASPEEPFIGDFVISGNLSASKNLYVDQDATIQGSLSVLGNFTYLDTIVSVTSALSVINSGTGPALTVVQNGPQPIARFIDGDASGGHAFSVNIDVAAGTGIIAEDPVGSIGIIEPQRKVEIAVGIEFVDVVKTLGHLVIALHAFGTQRPALHTHFVGLEMPE